jgi:hypothetical protein
VRVIVAKLISQIKQANHVTFKTLHEIITHLNGLGFCINGELLTLG